MVLIKRILKLFMLHILRSLWSCKFGFCVVAHPPNAQIFLLLRRGLFYVDALVLLDTFSNNSHDIQGSAFLPSWWLQLDNTGDTDFHYLGIDVASAVKRPDWCFHQ